MINDSSVRYGSVSKALHWVMAFLIGWQLLKLGDRIGEGEDWVSETLVPWHVSIGTLLLLLIVLRLAWVMKQRHHRPVHAPALAKLVKAGHSLLYAGMLLMPLAGIMVLLGRGYGMTVFGVKFFSKGEEVAWAASIGELHSPMAWILTLLIIGHVGMALIHHFILGDDTLKRML